MIGNLIIKRSIHANPDMFRSKSSSFKLYLKQQELEQSYFNLNNITDNYISPHSSYYETDCDKSNRKSLSKSYNGNDWATISKVLKGEKSPSEISSCDSSNDSMKKLFKKSSNNSLNKGCRQVMNESYDSNDWATISKVLKGEKSPSEISSCDFSNDSAKKLFKKCDFDVDIPKEMFVLKRKK